jgi:hypothetical protein
MLHLLRHLFRPADPLEAQLQERLELPIRFRPYSDHDLEACITLFRENQTKLPGDGGWDFIDFFPVFADCFSSWHNLASAPARS